jgi:hypothetical protein
MSEMQLDKLESQEIWVDINEATELTGYNRASMRKVAQRISRQPEVERDIKMRKRSNRWELWLPDLIVYLRKPGRGPHRKPNTKT